jgi:hypothetical protein
VAPQFHMVVTLPLKTLLGADACIRIELERSSLLEVKSTCPALAGMIMSLANVRYTVSFTMVSFEKKLKLVTLFLFTNSV